MDCRAFDSWLAADRPAAGERDAADHAAQCAACRAERAADDAVLAALAMRARPQADFTDRVMARISAERARAGSTEPFEPFESELLVPWWLQLLREPGVILGLTLGSLYAAGASWVIPVAQSAPVAVADVWFRAAAALRLAWPPLLVAGVLVPALGFASWALYRAASGAEADVPARGPAS